MEPLHLKWKKKSEKIKRLRKKRIVEIKILQWIKEMGCPMSQLKRS